MLRKLLFCFTAAFLLACYSNTYSQIVISSDTTWATNQTINQSVIVNPGVTLKIMNGVEIIVNYVDADQDSVGDLKFEVNGNLVLAGQPCDIVRFRPLIIPPAKGSKHWKGIHLNSSNSQDSLSFFSIEYADSGMWCHNDAIINDADFHDCTGGVMAFDSVTVSLSNCRIYNNKGTGVQIYNSSFVANNCHIYGNGKFGLTSHNSMINMDLVDISVNVWGGMYIGSGNILVQNTNFTNNMGAGVEISEWSFDTDFDTVGVKLTAPNVIINFCNIDGNSSTKTILSDSIVRKIVALPEPFGDCSGGNPALGLGQCNNGQGFELPFGSLDTAKPAVSHIYNSSGGTHHQMMYYLQNGYTNADIDSFMTTTNGSSCLAGNPESYYVEDGQFVVNEYTDRYRWEACGMTSATTQRPTVMDGSYSMKVGEYEVNSNISDTIKLDFMGNYWGGWGIIHTKFNEVAVANIDTFLPIGQSPTAGYFPPNYFPTANLGSDTALCPGKSVILGGKNQGNSYLWNTGDTTPTIFVTVGDTYSVQVTNFCGTGTDEAIVTIHGKPTVTINGDTSICQGQSTTLTATGVGDILWFINGSNNPTQNFKPNSSTFYLVMGTDTTGCTDTAKVDITVHPVDTAVQVQNDTLTASGTGTYQWLDCNNNNAAIPGETSKTFIPSSSGSYALAITIDTCTDTSNCHTIQLVSREDPFARLKVFPNPTRSTITVDFGSKQAFVALQLQDLTGRELVSRKEYGSNRSSMDLSAFPAGTYFLEIKSGNHRITRKVSLLH